MGKMSGITDPSERFFKDGIWGWDATDEDWIPLAADPTTGHLLTDVASLPLPANAATETTLGAVDGHVDDIEGLLASGLPSALDGDSLKVREQSPLTGFATSAKQDTLAGLVINKATTPTIYNVTMTLPHTEYSQALPANAKKFLIKCRGNYAIDVCFSVGQSGTTYVTVPAGMTYWEDLIQPSSLSLYFRCDTAARIAEIVAWS